MSLSGRCQDRVNSTGLTDERHHGTGLCSIRVGGFEWRPHVAVFWPSARSLRMRKLHRALACRVVEGTQRICRNSAGARCAGAPGHGMGNHRHRVARRSRRTVGGAFVWIASIPMAVVRIAAMFDRPPALRVQLDQACRRHQGGRPVRTARLRNRPSVHCRLLRLWCWANPGPLLNLLLHRAAVSRIAAGRGMTVAA